MRIHLRRLEPDDLLRVLRGQSRGVTLSGRKIPPAGTRPQFRHLFGFHGEPSGSRLHAGSVTILFWRAGQADPWPQSVDRARVSARMQVLSEAMYNETARGLITVERACWPRRRPKAGAVLSPAWRTVYCGQHPGTPTMRDFMDTMRSSTTVGRDPRQPTARLSPARLARSPGSQRLPRPSQGLLQPFDFQGRARPAPGSSYRTRVGLPPVQFHPSPGPGRLLTGLVSLSKPRRSWR